jgi:hypothetical protein
MMPRLRTKGDDVISSLLTSITEAGTIGLVTGMLLGLTADTVSRGKSEEEKPLMCTACLRPFQCLFT